MGKVVQSLVLQAALSAAKAIAPLIPRVVIAAAMALKMVWKRATARIMAEKAALTMGLIAARYPVPIARLIPLPAITPACR
jgi:hypothetical protein